MSARKFRAIFLPATAVLLATAIAVTCVMEYWSTVMDAVFGSAQVSTIPPRERRTGIPTTTT